jgi:prevent-host-death family protein
MSTVSAAEFNQRPSAVKRAAETEPVTITEHGKPSFVLLSFDEYQRLTGTPRNLAEWLRMDEDIDFEPEPLQIGLRPADL